MAEVAGSSPVVPAIPFKELPEVTPETPTHNSTHRSVHRLIHPNGRQEFALRRTGFIAVFLRIQIEGRLNLGIEPRYRKMQGGRSRVLPMSQIC